jgi:putative tricarboxylic transport membrane protein
VPGAAGTIGLARFVQSERGNPHALLVTGLVMVSGVIINHAPVTLADAIPIARLTGEFEVIVVASASPYRSLAALVAAFRANPGAVSWGGGSAGGTDDLLVRLIAEQVGLSASRVNYVAFAGGGAALGAILGGQVTAGVSGYRSTRANSEYWRSRLQSASLASTRRHYASRASHSTLQIGGGSWRLPGFPMPSARRSSIACAR